MTITHDMDNSSKEQLSPNIKFKYWYCKTIYYCVICGREKHYKSRVYSEQEKGIKFIEYACGEHFF